MEQSLKEKQEEAKRLAEKKYSEEPKRRIVPDDSNHAEAEYQRKKLIYEKELLEYNKKLEEYNKATGAPALQPDRRVVNPHTAIPANFLASNSSSNSATSMAVKTITKLFGL